MFYNKKKLKILESELLCYKSDYNHIREFNINLINKNQQLQQRIDKAIEKLKNRQEDINNGGNEYEYQTNKKLLEILGADDNEET